MTAPWIVGIGGSAGSLTPIKTILGGLPSTLNAAVLLTIHRHPQSDHFLSDALDGSFGFPVLPAEDGLAPEAGKVYVALPDRHLLFVDGTLRLSAGPRENRARPSIDVMLRSIAVECGTASVGVILSGMQNDGADGLRSIGVCGGTTIAQDPAEADYPEMPRKAAEVVPAAALGDAARIADMIQEVVGDAPPPAGAGSCPSHFRIERDIALGKRLNMATEAQIGENSNVTCPDCGGVLWHTASEGPLKLRCHTGHAFTAEVLASAQGEKVEEAFWVAMRTLRERAETLRSLADRAKDAGESKLWTDRAVEADGLADTLAEGIVRLGRLN